MDKCHFWFWWIILTNAWLKELKALNSLQFFTLPGHNVHHRRPPSSFSGAGLESKCRKRQNNRGNRYCTRELMQIDQQLSGDLIFTGLPHKTENHRKISKFECFLLTRSVLWTNATKKKKRRWLTSGCDAVWWFFSFVGLANLYQRRCQET